MNQVLIEIERLPEEALEDTMSGLGLAVAYSLFDDIEYSMRVAKLIPEKYKVAFTQGMAFGWEARRLQNKKYWNQAQKSVTDETKEHMNTLIQYVHQVKQTLSYTDDFYIQWMDVTRQWIKTNRTVDEVKR